MYNFDNVVKKKENNAFQQGKFKQSTVKIHNTNEQNLSILADQSSLPDTGICFEITFLFFFLLKLKYISGFLHLSSICSVKFILHCFIADGNVIGERHLHQNLVTELTNLS